MSQLALEGQVDNRDEVIDKLRSENRRLSEELRLSKLTLETVKSETGAVMEGVNELRNILTPLYRGLRLTFGEMEALPVNNSAPINSAHAASNPKLAIWKKWIDKFGSGSLNARFIIALLDHGQMTATQIRVVMQCATNSVFNTATRLKSLGLIEKSGGKYSLREL